MTRHGAGRASTTRGSITRSCAPVWTNQAEIAPGVWRSNHPTKARLKRLKALGLRTVISLRGGGDAAHNATERLWCEELGLTLRSVGMSDKVAPPP